MGLRDGDVRQEVLCLMKSVLKGLLMYLLLKVRIGSGVSDRVKLQDREEDDIVIQVKGYRGRSYAGQVRKRTKKVNKVLFSDRMQGSIMERPREETRSQGFEKCGRRY